MRDPGPQENPLEDTGPDRRQQLSFQYLWMGGWLGQMICWAGRVAETHQGSSVSVPSWRSSAGNGCSPTLRWKKKQPTGRGRFSQSKRPLGEDKGVADFQENWWRYWQSPQRQQECLKSLQVVPKALVVTTSYLPLYFGLQGPGMLCCFPARTPTSLHEWMDCSKQRP